MAGKRRVTTKQPTAPEPVPLSKLVSLKNLTPKPIALNLDHRSVCMKSGKCFCSKVKRQVSVVVDGLPGFRPEEKLICSSITLLGRKTDKFPRHVLLAADVQAAIENGIIRNLSAR